MKANAQGATSVAPQWFDVDRGGLADIVQRRGKATAVVELLSNALDQDVTRVSVYLRPMPNRPAPPTRPDEPVNETPTGLAVLVVTDDDPEGFRDLSHAYTLFAPSMKKGDAAKRGRFNLGEKLVLSLCEEATISSTKGTVRFDPIMGRKELKVKRQRGSEFHAIIRLDADDCAEVERLIRACIIPEDVTVTFNGERLTTRKPVREFEVQLPTEIAGEGGALRRSRRVAKVRLFDPRQGETASVYELGIPVVELGGGEAWHFDVGQKVPLNFERDNVTPAFLRELRAAVLNEAADLLTSGDSAQTWVKDAVASGHATDEAVAQVVQKRYGDMVVAADPKDPEAMKLAVAAGYTVVHGAMLSGDEWAAVKRAGLLKRAGLVTPSHSNVAQEAKGKPPIPEAKWTPGMRRVAGYAKALGQELLGVPISVVMHDVLKADDGTSRRAAFGQRELLLSKRGMRDIFDNLSVGSNGNAPQPVREALDSLLIHEFGHHYEPDHLSYRYVHALCDLGARLRTCKAKP